MMKIKCLACGKEGKPPNGKEQVQLFTFLSGDVEVYLHTRPLLCAKCTGVLVDKLRAVQWT